MPISMSGQWSNCHLFAVAFKQPDLYTEGEKSGVFAGQTLETQAGQTLQGAKHSVSVSLYPL